VVVVRYFGGVKLGVGPLGKAYYTSAHDSLHSAVILEKVLHVKTIIESPLTEQHLVFSLLSRAGITDIRTAYTEECIFETLIPKESYEGIISLFKEHYRIRIKGGEEIYI